MTAFVFYGTQFGEKVAGEVIGTPIGQFLGWGGGKIGNYLNDEINEANYTTTELVN